MLILILPAIAAQVENYNNYSMLDIQTEFSSSAFAMKKSTPRVDFFSVNLSFFPRDEGQRQLVESLVMNSTPKAKITQKDDYIEYYWKDPAIRQEWFKYSVKANVKTVNSFNKITRTIRFPVDDIPREFKMYVEPSEYIDTNDQIKNKANEIIAGETDYYIVIYKLAQWVEKNVNYNLSTLTANAVQKSSWVLTNKEGVCDEITNLYISMLRAVGIPARFVGGQVYTNINYKFGEHGWAEVYYPGEGWIPVDVTFGQVGWIDPTHIKFKHALDSGDPTVKFSWKSMDVDFKTNPLIIETKVLQASGEPNKQVGITIEPLEKVIGPNSYMPIMVTVINPHDYYVPLQVRLTKGPEIYNDVRQTILLRPLEEKQLFWIVKSSEDLRKNIIYTSTIEAATNFGTIATTELQYELGEKVYDEEWAKKQIESFKPKDEKEYFPGIKIDCELDQPYYYTTEIATLSCIVKNIGNQPLTNIKSCYSKDCKTLNLGITEENDVEWEIDLRGFEDEVIIISAETENTIKRSYMRIEIIEEPNIVIEQFKPENMSYGYDGNLSFLLVTNAPARDIKVKIEGFGEAELKELNTKRELLIPFNSKEILREDVNVVLTYKDIVGKEYKRMANYNVKVLEKPWFIRFLLWFETHLN